MVVTQEIFTANIKAEDWDKLENFKSNIEKATQHASDVFVEYASIFLDCAKQLTQNSIYISRLQTVINFITKKFNLTLMFVSINPSKYTIAEWGNVYWKFMHSASILYEIGNKSDSELNEDFFPYIIYNIDFVIPCGNCKAHYSQIKKTDNITNIVKKISFGNYISGVYEFHNAITNNINSLTRSNRNLFSPLEFAQQWFLFSTFTEPATLTTYNTSPVIPADKATFYKAIILAFTTHSPWPLHLGKTYKPDKFPIKLETPNKVIADQLNNIDEELKTPYPIIV